MKVKYTKKELKLRAKESDTNVFSRGSSGIIGGRFEITTENKTLLQQCQQDWENLAYLRAKAYRNKQYYLGYHWYEKIRDENGKWISEKEYIEREGRIAFKQNIIKQLMRNILGVYRKNPTQSVIYPYDRQHLKYAEIMGNALMSALDVNQASELDVNALEYFLVSGLGIQKVEYDYIQERDRSDVLLNLVNVNRIFMNTDVRDPRLTDIYRIGEIIDTTLDRILQSFAKTKEDEMQLREMYRYAKDDGYSQLGSRTFSGDENNTLNFIYSKTYDICRVIVVWHQQSRWRLYVHDELDGTIQFLDPKYKSQLEAINQQRVMDGTNAGVPLEAIPLMNFEMKFEPTWYVKYLHPDGYCLFEGESPYKHQQHPYVLGIQNFYDGTISTLVEDLIDHNRIINRMIILQDDILGNAAKGLLMVPEEAIPADLTIDDFASEWSKTNGIIKFKAKAGVPIPQVVQQNVNNVGAYDMLNVQLKLITDIAGVSGAIQGQEARSGTPSSLYAQMAQNSMINMSDMFERFANFKKRRDLKVIKVIQQYYKDGRIVNGPGRKSNTENIVYSQEMADIDMDVRLQQGVDTPTYKAMADDFLMELLKLNMINLKMFLQSTSLPFADRLLEQVQQFESTQQMTPEMMAQMRQAQADAQQNSNPQTMAMINQMMQ